MDTTIKVDSAIRDRLALLARERGTTVRDLVAELAHTRLSEAELRERATRATDYLRGRVVPDLDQEDIDAGDRFWRALESGEAFTEASRHPVPPPGQAA